MPTVPTTFAEAQAVLATRLPGYEARPQQVALATQVEALFANPANFSTEGTRQHVIGQAGTGCGKSLAYLIPAILWSAKTRRRVVVSVTTKALQGQLAGKDLPFLQENLGVDFSWTVLKGRSNYLCLNIASSVEAADCPSLARIRARGAEADFSGEREDLGFDVPDADWFKVKSDGDVCSDLGCKKNLDPTLKCFAAAARAHAQQCQVVIVNHALLFTDLFAAGGNLLGHYDAVVFDEAHETEDVAAQALGTKLTEVAFVALASEVRNFGARYVEDTDGIDTACAALTTSARSLFIGLQVGKFTAAHLGALDVQFEAVADALVSLREAVAKASIDKVAIAESAKARVRKSILVQRTNRATDTFHNVITATFEELVRWVEVEKTKRGERKALRTCPVTVSAQLREHLFSKTPAVLVSATLAVKGTFDYIAGRLGVDNFDGLDVGTPFNYPEQARLYVPRHLPAPVKADRARWQAEAAEETLALIRASNGRALVLFTSVASLKATLVQIGARIKADHTLLVQGEGTVRDLTDRFKSDTSSVLFGTKSFFTGIDVQGEALSLVIVDKLPFPVPTEPVIEARCAAIEAAGGNAFSDYTIPVMSLVLQQAAGRVIRHTTDTGVIAILDPRLVTSKYGQRIVRDLPPATQVDNLTEVESFLTKEAQAV